MRLPGRDRRRRATRVTGITPLIVSLALWAPSAAAGPAQDSPEAPVAGKLAEVRAAKERGDRHREGGNFAAAAVAYTEAYELLRADPGRDEASVQQLVELGVDSLYRAYQPEKNAGFLCQADALLEGRLAAIEAGGEALAGLANGTRAMHDQIEGELASVPGGSSVCETPEDEPVEEGGGETEPEPEPEPDPAETEPEGPSPTPAPVIMTPERPPPSKLLKAGIGTTVIGFGVLGLGVVLWAVHQGCVDKQAGSDGCPDDLGPLKTSSIVSLTVGATAAVTGLSLILVDYYRTRKAPVQVTPVAGAQSAGIVVSGRF